MIPPAVDGTRGAVRLAVLDDNPFVRDASGAVRPRAALFHRFAAAVVARGGLPPATYLAPVGDLTDGASPPTLDAIDPACLRIVPTAPFAGIAGYLRHGPSLTRQNWPIIRDAVAEADLLWIKAPASNAVLAALAARQADVPRFTWVAGSVRDVVAGSGSRGIRRMAGAAAAIAYDSTTRLLERTGPAIRLGPELFTSVVTDAEIDAALAAPPRDADEPLRIAWSGRMAADKGIPDLLSAVASVVADGLAVRLVLVGDGPARADVEARVADLGLGDMVDLRGYVGDRAAYMDALRSADMFVLPSHAEGVPKVVVEAMAAGLPVIATAVGAVPAVLADGRGRLVPIGDPSTLAAAIRTLADDPEARVRLRAAGLTYAADHTIDSQARRMLTWMTTTFPNLPWARP